VQGGVSFLAGRNRRLVSAALYAEDRDKDVCILTAKDIDGKPADMGKAAGLTVWDQVFAVGATLGSEPSLSEGTVAQLWGGPPPLIQMRATISPDGIGGGLFDGDGRLVGLTTLYKEGERSLNFAMPAEWIGEVKPGLKPAEGRRGEVEWLKRSVFLAKSMNWEGLHAWGLEWTKNEPTSSTALYFLGVAGRNLKQHAEAIASFRQALGMDPKNATAWFELGVTYSSLKRHNEAIESYRHALLVKPEFTAAWINLGVTYALSGNQTAAMDVARELRRLDPPSADMLMKMTISR
jgi:hypothetical protein